MDDDIEFVDALERRLVDGIAASRRSHRMRRALVAAAAATFVVVAGVAGVAAFRGVPDERLEGAAATSPPVSSGAPDTAASSTSTSEPVPTTTLGVVPTAAEEPTTSASTSTSTTVEQCPPSRPENYQYPIRTCDGGFAAMAIRLRLAELGYLADAYEPVVWFDDVTEDAVRRFQADNGLEPDGLVGPLTWRALAPDVQAPDDNGNGIVDPFEIVLDVGGECEDLGTCPPRDDGG